MVVPVPDSKIRIGWPVRPPPNRGTAIPGNKTVDPNEKTAFGTPARALLLERHRRDLRHRARDLVGVPHAARDRGNREVGFEVARLREEELDGHARSIEIRGAANRSPRACE